MIKDISIAAKAELKDETIARLCDGQKEIELAKIAALTGVANSAFELMGLAQKARIAEAEVEALQARARIAEAEVEKAKYLAEQAKYAADSAASDAAFRKAAKSKKPYTNGVAYNAE